MKRILVTGGFGFLGSHLVERLLQEPDVAVHVVDDLSTSPINLSAYLKELGESGNLTYTIATVNTFCAHHATSAYDEIYHLASIVGPAGVLPHGGRIVYSIVHDTYALMDMAIASRAKLVDVSTSEVYGGGRNGYCSEAMPKIIPAKTTIRLEYAVAKLASETAIINSCALRELNACIVRPFNIAGPRQSGKGGFVLPRFLSQALSRQPITVFGNGKQIRAFTHVKDMADGMVCAMKYGKNGECYNLGNPANRITIIRLAELVTKITQSDSPIEFVDPKTIYGPMFEDANDKYPDSARAMSELGWKPTRSLETIITDAMNELAKSEAGLMSGVANPKYQ